jgi:hypothetical protein
LNLREKYESEQLLPAMTETEISQIIHSLDHALNIFRRNEGRLTAAQIRARSLLAVTRSEMAQALSDSCHDRKLGTEVFVNSSTSGARAGESSQAQSA